MRRAERRQRLRGEEGAALIIALVFLVVFAVLAVVVADLGFTTFKASETVSESGDSLFGADDMAERTQNALQDGDPVCATGGAAAVEKLHQKDGRLFRVVCEWLKAGENPMPGFHLAMLLFSEYEDALVKVGEPPASLSGNVRLNTDEVCFRASPDGFITGIGQIGCENPPDLRAGVIAGVTQYAHVGPIDLRADGEGNPATIEIPAADCTVPGWVPSPVDYAGAQHNPAWDGPHLRNAAADGTNPVPFTAASWACRDGAEADLWSQDPAYPEPDTSSLPTKTATAPADTDSTRGVLGDCRDFGTNMLNWPFFGTTRVRYSCVRWFDPGRYTDKPSLGLTSYHGGYPAGVRANVFRPGLYWFDSDLGYDPATPWHPDPGFNLAIRDKWQDAPVVMGTPHDAIVANSNWTADQMAANVPLDQRCQKGEPGVQLLFNQGYGIWVNYGGSVQPAAPLSACHPEPGQIPGATPGIVLYQRKYDAATWAAGFSNWPGGVTRPEAPAWGTMVLFNSDELLYSGGVTLDGTIYAPHGLIKAAVGFASTAGMHLASGILAFGLQLKSLGSGGQVVASEQPTFVDKLQVSIWDCGDGTAADTTLVDACRADPAPDVRALVDAASPAPGGGGPATLRFDRWLPS